MTPIVSKPARPGTAQVGLTGGDGPYDLLLGIGGEVAPVVDDLDANVAARTLLDLRRRSADRGKVLQVAGGVGHSQDHRLTGAAGLVAASPVAAAAPRHDGRDHGEGNGREPGSAPHPAHGPTPFLEGRG